MADYTDSVYRLEPDSDIVRIYPGALVQVYASGAGSLITEVTADADGQVSIPTLATGKYDLRVQGKTVKVIQHVKADHTHKTEPTWRFFIAGAITADQAELDTQPIHLAPVAGKIISVRVVAEHVTAAGDVFVHLLKGATNGASALTLAATIWNHRINPGVERYRYAHADANPALQLAANDCVTLGVDHTANGVSGLTVEVVFRPD